ncbi:MAG: rhodanese-like domain-containing protein [Candidatus Poseidoniaceae archaeon]|nr:rhodanese-like domain-containing protein [Candidatus Poseidoniaceae archaeon]
MFQFIRRFFASNRPSTSQLIGEGAIIIDVRTPAEFRNGRGKNTRNIPLQTIEKKVSSLRKQNKVIITCCASGMRSGRAAKVLNKAGLEAYNGGAWSTVEKARKQSGV